jgi:hypothetical protein
MAHAEILPDQTLNLVAAEIGSRIALLGGHFSGQAVELGETFSVWMIDAPSSTQNSPDVAQIATSTDRWHHQIKVAGKAAAFARSTQRGTGAQNWSVEAIVNTLHPVAHGQQTMGLAQRIDEAIEWIDKHVQGDPLVRLLCIPSDYLWMFWLTANAASHLLVVEKPERYVHLAYHTLYTSHAFFQALNQEFRSFAIRSPAIRL